MTPRTRVAPRAPMTPTAQRTPMKQRTLMIPRTHTYTLWYVILSVDETFRDSYMRKKPMSQICDRTGWSSFKLTTPAKLGISPKRY